jgi:serine/threonine-protein kinase
MELVEGPTLAERIGGRAMPIEQALPIAKQIAEALDYAHAKGIIHRDLKPANVKLTGDGNVKVLDFGLAKALERPAAAASDPSISPTFTLEGTQEGVILGTAAYMAPEQARGEVLDKRADIWSFGVVLYEMLTGKRPFAGATVSDTLASVLKTEPDLNRVPQQARRLLERCLEKNSKRRLRDIGEAQYLLEAPPQAVSAPRGSLWWKIAAAALTVVLVIALWGVWRVPRPTVHPLMRLMVDLGVGMAVDSSVGPPFAIAPDSSRLAYVSRDSNSKTHLFVRALDRSNSMPLDGTEGAAAPFFSPDSRSIAFFAGEKLKRISVDGGTAIVLSDAPNPWGGDWGEDGNILFRAAGQFLRVPSSGGTARPVFETKRKVGERDGQLLPGAKALLFTASTSWGWASGAKIDAEVIASGARKTLVKEA